LELKSEVQKAIERAEKELNSQDSIYCLGEIVHNDAEIHRLNKRGLKTITHDEFKKLHDISVLIRAHGEPPETYKIAKRNHIKLVDATCPIVSKLQNRIKTCYDEILDEGGQIVIYGKKGHAEVNGLVGQTGGRAIVVEDSKDLDKVDFSKPINLFSQTTKSITGFHKIKSIIEENIENNDEENFISNDTICRQVASRGDDLPKFARAHDIIIFVSGKKSSNGKMLHEICRKENKRSYFVSDIEDIKTEWFKHEDTIGICGATSTPMWLMNKIAEYIQTLEK